MTELAFSLVSSAVYNFLSMFTLPFLARFSFGLFYELDKFLPFGQGYEYFGTVTQRKLRRTRVFAFSRVGGVHFARVHVTLFCSISRGFLCILMTPLIWKGIVQEH